MHAISLWVICRYTEFTVVAEQDKDYKQHNINSNKINNPLSQKESKEYRFIFYYSFSIYNKSKA